VAFRAADRDAVNAFHLAAIGIGAEILHAPRIYGAFVRDPDGHNIEAVCHAPSV